MKTETAPQLTPFLGYLRVYRNISHAEFRRLPWAEQRDLYASYARLIGLQGERAVTVLEMHEAQKAVERQEAIKDALGSAVLFVAVVVAAILYLAFGPVLR